MLKTLAIMCVVGLSACGVGIPDGVTAVNNFELTRYLGTWYEIARLDHSFERGLTKVTAQYSVRDDGNVRVVNRGFNVAKQVWDEAEGVAKFVEAPNVGRLKVSFWGPFYAGYNVIEVDPAYTYSLVVGSDRDYLWILSRTPTLDEATQQRLVARAAELGFATEQLIFVQQ